MLLILEKTQRKFRKTFDFIRMEFTCVCYAENQFRENKRKGEKEMKVLITTDWYKPAINGVVTSVCNLREELQQRGHEVKILTLSRTAHSYEEEGVIYMGSVNAGYIYPGARLRVSPGRELYCRIIEWQPDIVHSQCEFSTFLWRKGSRRNVRFLWCIPTIPYTRIIPIIFHLTKNGAEIWCNS
mgnify:CR=1 FL=1